MKTYNSLLTWEQIIDRLKTNRSRGFVPNIDTAYTSLKVFDDEVKIFGAYCVGQLHREHDGVSL